MPMWGAAKGKSLLLINPLEFTRARLDSERRGRQRAEATAAVKPPKPKPAPNRSLNDSYIEAVRMGLADIDRAYLDMVESPRALPIHIDPLHRLSLDLRDVAKPAGFLDLAQAAGSLAQLCKAADRAAAHPELIRLHIDSMRTLAEQIARGGADGRSGQLLEALKLAVGSAIGE